MQGGEQEQVWRGVARTLPSLVERGRDTLQRQVGSLRVLPRDVVLQITFVPDKSMSRSKE